MCSTLKGAYKAEQRTATIKQPTALQWAAQKNTQQCEEERRIYTEKKSLSQQGFKALFFFFLFFLFYRRYKCLIINNLHWQNRKMFRFFCKMFRFFCKMFRFFCKMFRFFFMHIYIISCINIHYL